MKVATGYGETRRRVTSILPAREWIKPRYIAVALETRRLVEPS